MQERWQRFFLGKCPIKPIDFKTLSQSGLTQLEMDYIMVSVTTFWIYHHPQRDDQRVNVRHIYHLWHDHDKAGFIRLMNNLDQTFIDLKNTPNYPNFLPLDQGHLCSSLSNSVSTVIPQCFSNNDDDKSEDCYKGIELFLQQ